MRLRLAFLMALLAATMLAALSPPASASTSATEAGCKRYINMPGHGAGVVCLYPAAAYPGFRGKVFGPGAPCGARIFPPDAGDQPYANCLAVPTIPSWKWTGAWQRSSIEGGSYRVYPYSGNWRWVFSDGYWNAVDAGHFTIRWFCPAGGTRACYAV